MNVQSSGTLQSASSFSESESKTGSSSKSITSAADKEKQRDLTKDNVSSPIDLECHIQAERIIKLLNEALYKTQLAVCLPNLIEEYDTLNSILSNADMEDLYFIFEHYDNPLLSTSLINMAAVDDIKAGDISLKNRLNPELEHLFHILNGSPALKPKIEEMISQMKTKYMNLFEDDILGWQYLQQLEHFRDLMAVQVNITAADELMAKIDIKKLEASNDKLTDKIKEYKGLMTEENERFEEIMKIKTKMIAKLERELIMLKHDASIDLKKKVLDSERQMVVATRVHSVKNEMLKEEATECREHFERLLKQHIIEEKNQRARRFKVETKLLSWLQKYDLEMREKQIELDEFTEKYDDEVRKCEELEAKLEEQNKEFDVLMAEREGEYQQEMTEKMNKFITDHAARVIQNAWRQIQINRAEKKRLTKLLHKKVED